MGSCWRPAKGPGASPGLEAVPGSSSRKRLCLLVLPHSLSSESRALGSAYLLDNFLVGLGVASSCCG